MYSVSVYFITKVKHFLTWHASYFQILFDLIPLRILPTLSFCAVAYYMIGYSKVSSAFGNYLLVLVVFNSVMSLLSIFMAVIVQKESVAIMSTSILLLVCMLFGGFFLNIGN